jgi:MFS family permease
MHSSIHSTHDSPTGAISESLSIGIVAACIGLMFAGSTIVTPLYAAYQKLFGFSELTLTLIYAAYVLGNLGALLVFGRLSDQTGRRPVILLGIAVACISTLVFLFAQGTLWLACGRALSGLAIGLTASTATAWLAELYGGQEKARATTLAIGGNMAGLAFGALLAGLLSQDAPWPLHLSFVIYLVALLSLAAIMLAPRETVAHPEHRLRKLSMQPRLGVPREIRAQFFAPAVTGFGSMALFGFYAAIAPSILSTELHQTSRAVSGGLVAEMCIVATLTVLATRRLTSRASMLGGLALMLPAVALLVWAQTGKSMALLLIGTTLAGIAAALGYRGSLQVINQIAPTERRAEVVSSYMLAAFAGNSLPIIGVGVITSLSSSILASIVFACTIGVFAVTALIIGLKYSPRET